jgi:hypothetical protein
MPDHVGSGRGAAVPDQLTASREVFMEFKRRTLNHRRHDLSTAADIALHVDLWLVDRRRQALRWIHDAGGTDLALDDLDRRTPARSM